MPYLWGMNNEQNNSYNFSIGKATWNVSIMSKTGRVYVTKTSLPRHMRFGKCYENIEQALANYKSADMKMHLELANLGF